MVLYAEPIYVTEYKNILFDFRHFYTVYNAVHYCSVCLYSIVVHAVHYSVFYAVLFMQYITPYLCSTSHASYSMYYHYVDLGSYDTWNDNPVTVK